MHLIDFGDDQVDDSGSQDTAARVDVEHSQSSSPGSLTSPPRQAHADSRTSSLGLRPATVSSVADESSPGSLTSPPRQAHADSRTSSLGLRPATVSSVSDEQLLDAQTTTQAPETSAHITRSASASSATTLRDSRPGM